MYDKLSFLVRKDAVLKKEEFTQKVAEQKKEDSQSFELVILFSSSTKTTLG